MPSTIVPFAPAENLLQASAEKRKCASPVSRTKLSEPSRICEPEARLWKLSSAGISPAQAIIEWVVLALFFVIAIAVMASCVAELSVLMQTDAVGQVASKALSGETGTK